MDDKNSLQVPKLMGYPYSGGISPRVSDTGEYIEDGDIEPGAMGYQQTLMYGRYSRSLADELKEEMKRQKMLEKSHKREFKKIKSELR